MILQISASQEARVAGMSHQHLAEVGMFTVSILVQKLRCNVK
jgi:hypothetical protein